MTSPSTHPLVQSLRSHLAQGTSHPAYQTARSHLATLPLPMTLVQIAVAAGMVMHGAPKLFWLVAIGAAVAAIFFEKRLPTNYYIAAGLGGLISMVSFPLFVLAAIVALLAYLARR